MQTQRTLNLPQIALSHYCSPLQGGGCFERDIAEQVYNEMEPVHITITGNYVCVWTLNCYPVYDEVDPVFTFFPRTLLHPGFQTPTLNTR